MSFKQRLDQSLRSERIPLSAMLPNNTRFPEPGQAEVNLVVRDAPAIGGIQQRYDTVHGEALAVRACLGDRQSQDRRNFLRTPMFVLGFLRSRPTDLHQFIPL